MVEFISKTDKQYYLRRLGQLDLEYSSFRNHWKELSEYIEPRKGNFFVTDRNKGDKRNTKIINSRGTQAHRNAQSGLFAGTASPTKPWFTLEPLNHNLMRSQPVRQWGYDTTQALRQILLSSNFYSAYPTTVGEAVLFATGAMSQVDDFDNVTHFYTHTIGSYYIATDGKGEVDTFVEKRDWTVKQIVDTFGRENCSVQIQTQYDRAEYDIWHTICQFIDPNPQFDPGRADETAYMPWRSAWFELGHISASGGTSVASSTVFTDNKFLRKSGFSEFPVHVFRWSTTGSDQYGTNCPGMVALADVKMLQVIEKRKAQAIDKLINPPLKGPPSLRDVPISSLPGGVTLYDMDATKEGLSPLYQFEPRINELRDEILRVENRINEAFFVDLFLAISTMEGIQPKNQLELSQRNAERLLMLGPPLERLQQDFLGKVIQRTFNQALRADILPPPPPELEGESLNINFISSLSHAQRLHEVQTIERVSLFTGQLAQVSPQVLDKFNADEALEQYAIGVGSVPSLLVPQEQVDQTRQVRAQQQQAAMEAQMMEQQAAAGKNVSGAVKDVAEAENVGE